MGTHGPLARAKLPKRRERWGALLASAAALGAALAPGTAAAATLQQVEPMNGARFAVGARIDFRVRAEAGLQISVYVTKTNSDESSSPFTEGTLIYLAPSGADPTLYEGTWKPMEDDRLRRDGTLYWRARRETTCGERCYADPTGLFSFVLSDDKPTTQTDMVVLAPVDGARVRYGRRVEFRWDPGSPPPDPGPFYPPLRADYVAWGDSPASLLARPLSTISQAGPGVMRAIMEVKPGTYWWRVYREAGPAQPDRASVPRSLKVLAPRLSTLRVKEDEHRRRSSRRPGRTFLRIATTPYVRVELVLRRNGKRERVKRFDTTRRRISKRLRFRWSCDRPGVYRYAVTATDAYGSKRVRHGRWTVSRERCRALRRAEARVRRRRAEERARRREYIRRRDQRCRQSGGESGNIGGDFKCLKSGQRCDPANDEDYHFYDMHCHPRRSPVVLIFF